MLCVSKDIREAKMENDKKPEVPKVSKTPKQ